MNCLACDRIKQIEVGDNPYFVTELRESYVVFADHQRYEGYCILLLKSHVAHLGELARQTQLDLFGDVADIAAAITDAFDPVRLNYARLGNELGHVHWHVIPRYAWDPQPHAPIWVRPKEERHTGGEPARLAELKAILQSALKGDVAP